MKNKLFNILILSIILLVSLNSYSQNCKYEINDINPETNTVTKITKDLKVYSTFNTVGVISFSNYNDEYSLEFCHVFFAGCATSYEGCEITFLLENGSELTLKKGKVNYLIKENQLNQILKSRISKIRYQYGDNPTNSKFTENQVNPKKAIKINEMIKCIL